METVTLKAVVTELLDQMIPEGPMPDNYANSVVRRVGFDTKNLMVAKTTRLCEMFAFLSSHSVCEEEEVASGFSKEAILDAKAALINGSLRDLLCLLLEAQRKASAEVEKKTGLRPVALDD